MDLLKMAVVFLLIIVATKFKKPLYVAMLAGSIGVSLLYGINPLRALQIMGMAIISPVTIMLVLSFYSITFLQRMMEKRKQLILAEQSLIGIFNSRRVNAMIAPFIIGLLPSAGAVLIACPIVDNAGGEDISKEDKTFITSYFRHISEAFLPTYASIILALQLSGVDMTAFVLSMLPIAGILFLLGYWFYVKKIPQSTGVPASNDKVGHMKNFMRSIWTIAAIIVIILVFKLQVHIAVSLIILLNFIIDRFSWEEVRPMFASAFESKLIFSTIAIMMFKDILTYTGVIHRLPETIAVLPIPPVIVFALVFLIGTIVAGIQAIIALGIPLAFAAIPSGGTALMVLLMSMSYIAMQVSPTHICLALVTESFGTSFLDLVKRTIPVMLCFLVILAGYSYLLFLFQ
jgi:integral membrane protein (TIGR00529 family)